MELTIPVKKFVCVDYPGVVVNADKMLQTLGNEKNISKTYNDPSKRLELWFRPREVGCKPVFGDRHKCSSFVLKVRRRRKRTANNNESDVPTSNQLADTEQFDYDAKILGVIDVMYSFQSLSDFQYLPIVRQPSGTYTSIREKVFITKLHDLSWLMEPSPMFLPPLMFSRFDHSVDYCYREPPQPRQGREHELPKLAPDVIGVSRKRRPHFTQFLHFNDKVVPISPNPSALLKMKSNLDSAAAAVKQMFEIQPVWSRNALVAHVSPDISLTDVCVVLPTMAYYFVTGPWRTMWVRFGYDPRCHPEAKIFQTLDVRLRRYCINDNIPIKAKRSAYDYVPKNMLKTQSQPPVIQNVTFASVEATKDYNNSLTTKSGLDATYRFRPGLLPSSRQMFYQLCYVDEPQVQSLIHANDGEESECLEKDGWCLRDTMEKCRALLSVYVRAKETSVASGAVSADTLQSSQIETEFDGQEEVEEVPPGEEDDDDEVDEAEDNNEEDEDAIVNFCGGEDDDDDDAENTNDRSVLTDLTTELS